MRKKVKYKWTVIYLIKAVDITWQDAKQMIADILDTDENVQVSIVFCLTIQQDNIAEFVEPGDRQDSKSSGGITTLFLEVKSAGKNGNRNKVHLVKEVKNFDLRNPTHIALYFKQQVLKAHTAERYLLFTWDHGIAYGMFRGGPDALPGKPVNGATESIKNVFNMLTAGDLASAIREAFGEIKIDIIIMMNCYMQFFDTGFALSAAANYLVAAETLFYDMKPFNYKMIFGALSATPDMGAKELCCTAIDSISACYADRIITTTQLGVAVFATELKYYPAIAQKIDELSVALTEILENNFTVIRDCRKVCGQIPGVPAALVDFTNFIRLVQLSMPLGWQIETLRFLSAILEKAIFSKYVHRVYSIETVDHSCIQPAGFSVTFPVHMPDPDAAEDFYTTFIQAGSPHATLFSRQHRWKDFVAAYLSGLAAQRTSLL